MKDLLKNDDFDFEFVGSLEDSTEFRAKTFTLTL